MLITGLFGLQKILTLLAEGSAKPECITQEIRDAYTWMSLGKQHIGNCDLDDGLIAALLRKLIVGDHELITNLIEELNNMENPEARWMDDRILNRNIKNHMAQSTLDSRILEALTGFKLLLEAFKQMEDPGTRTEGLKQQLQQALERLPEANSLCEESGEPSRKDFGLCLRNAETLLARLYEALPEKG